MTQDPSDFVSVGAAADTRENAQWWLLFAIMVANKPAESTRTKLTEVLLFAGTAVRTPFQKIEYMAEECDLAGVTLLYNALRWSRTGQYKRIERAFRGVAVMHANPRSSEPSWGDDPRDWSLNLLESVQGIGPKTARWFYMLCHPEAKVAALDTHVLKFLRDQGVRAPKTTPPAGAEYTRLERRFVECADGLNIPPRDFDFLVWTVYRNGGHVMLPLSPDQQDDKR